VAVIVPAPHEPLSPLGVEMIRPAGSVSLNATPVSPTVVLPLVIVNCKLVDPFSAMLAAPNALLIVGGATTVTVAVAVLLLPPSVELTCTELFLSPAVVPCTFTETAHEALAASVPPDRLTEPAPPVAVAVPPQVLFRFGVDATTSPAGRLSVNANPLSVALLFGLLMLIRSKVLPFSGIFVGANVLVPLGGLTTVRLAVLLVAPVPPLVELTAPVVLGILAPDSVPVMFTTTVQVAPGVAMLPLD